MSARLEQSRRELAYRFYVTDSLSLSVQGKYISKRYVDTIIPPVEDNRPALEIAHDILSRAGLEVSTD